MFRRPRDPKFHPIEAGVCLLACDILSRHGIACPSEAEVLALLGLSELKGVELEEHSYALKSLVLDRVIDGYLSKLPVAMSGT